jgi:hypothetical protein
LTKINYVFIAFLISILFSSCISPRNQPLYSLDNTTILDHMEIEIVPVEGSTVNSAVITSLINNLNDYRICSRDNIIVYLRSPVHSNKRSWSHADVVAFEDQHRIIWDRNNQDRHLKLFISCLPGTYTEKGLTDISGLVYGYRNTISLFQGCFERSVLLHEIGHIIGLVDNSTRGNPPVNIVRPNHCNNSKCVMFWVVSRDAIFDEKCINDIANMIRRRAFSNYIIYARKYIEYEIKSFI